MSNDCCTYGCIGTGKDCPARSADHDCNRNTTSQARVADWVEAFPDFYQNEAINMPEPFQIAPVDEPSLCETMRAFFDNGCRFMLCAALLAAVLCIGLALYFK